MDTAQTDLQIVPLQPLRKTAIRSIKSQVVLGTPSAGCQGVGICRVIASGMNQNFKCPTVNAQISATAFGRLRIKFSKTAMDRRFMKRHFGWRLFQVMEPYRIPDTLINKFDLVDDCHVIEPGIYSVWETREWLIVDF